MNEKKLNVVLNTMAFMNYWLDNNLNNHDIEIIKQCKMIDRDYKGLEKIFIEGNHESK
jgi:hypothetical protein